MLFRSLQVAIIYAVVNNMLSDIPVNRIQDFERELSEYLVASRDELLRSIRESGALSAEAEAELKESINIAKAKFLA